jgi:hypothetical protein
MFLQQIDFLGACVVFNYYVHALRGGFSHVSGVYSIFFFDYVNDGGKVAVYIECDLYRVTYLLAIR